MTKPFEEIDRYHYPDLTPDSVVMDVGCHEGNFAAMLHQKYRCRIHAYEPVPEFFNQCVKRFRQNPDIRMWSFAIGGANGIEQFGVKGDMSGQFCTSANKTISVPVRDISEIFNELYVPKIALLKLNCEGGEYDILERIVSTNMTHLFTHLQVQFHTVAPNFKERDAAIRAALKPTHQLMYDTPFCWTGWSQKP